MGLSTALPAFQPQSRNGVLRENPPLPGRRCGLVKAVCLATLLLSGCQKKQQAPPPSPPEVKVTEVIQQNVPVYSEWVAQLNGPNNAQITPRVQGYLLSQDYYNGFFVKKGQLLYEIDSRPFIVSVDQAKAQVAEAEANLSQATTNVVRDRPLAAQNAIPQKQLDTDVATQAASQAQLDASKAALAQAQLNLSWTKVYSPIDGIAGVSTAQVGNLVGTTTNMTMVSQVNPIWAYFNISETSFLSKATTFYAVITGKKVKSPAIQFIQSNGQTYPQTGKIIQINRNITSETGTIQLAAEFPNKQAILRPGGFGRVRFLTDLNQNALLVPQAAVIEIQSMYQVVVVGPENRAAFRPVEVGDKVGENWIITKGLNPGDKVIVEGFMKVREGTPVIAKPYVANVAGNE
ncbi:MAG: efflux RND transporter periplasmic adaptor subunit [Acidobacteriaceae bacterium]